MIGISIGVRQSGAAVPGVFTMTQLAQANRVYQRATLTGAGQAKGQGAVPVTINVSGAGTLFARCRSAADGTTIVQAPWLAFASVAAGAGTRSIAGVDARLGWFYLDLSGDGVSWQNGTTPIGMGALAAMSGQSLMTRLFHKYTSEDTTTIAGAGASVPANGRIFASIDTVYNSIGSGAGQTPTAWVQPSDTTTNHGWSAALNGAGGAELLTRLIALAGVNVGLVAKTEGATSITAWQAGQPLGDALTATMDAAGGKFEALIWYQGHSDSNAGMTAAARKAQLSTLFANLAAHNSFAAPAIVLATIPNIASTSWGTVAAKETIRRADAEWAAANGASWVAMNDIALGSDGVHALQAGSVRQAQHFARALRPHFGAAADDRGAILGTPTHAPGSADIVIPFTLPAGATGLSAVGAAETRFKVYKGGTRASALAFDATAPFAIDNAGRTITLKLAADPGQAPLDILPFGANDPANDGAAAMVRDDLSDADGVPGRQLYPGVTALHVAVNRDLVMTSPTYGAGRFGNTLATGKGVTSSAILPALAEGFRIEAWVKANTVSSTLAVFCGAGGAAWIGVQNNDLKVVVGGNSAVTRTIAGVLTTGVWHHVALTVEAPGLTFTAHVDGVLQGSYAVTSDYDGSANVFGIRTFGGVTGFDPTSSRVADEVAIWRGQWPATVMPSAPYAGNEPGLLALWHLDGDGMNAAG